MYKPNLSKEEIRLCFFRSLCVSIFLMLCFFAVHFVDNTIWITSLAATSFITFAFPKADAVKARVVIGGYIFAGLCGTVCSLLLDAVGNSYIAVMLLCLVAVFLTSFSMTVLDLEHPPAAALAVALVLSDKPITHALLALFMTAILCLVKVPISRLMLGNTKENKS